jgi:hypothetical protein
MLESIAVYWEDAPCVELHQVRSTKPGENNHPPARLVRHVEDVHCERTYASEDDDLNQTGDEQDFDETDEYRNMTLYCVSGGFIRWFDREWRDSHGPYSPSSSPSSGSSINSYNAVFG